MAKLVEMAFMRIGVEVEVAVLTYHAVISPISVTKIVSPLRCGGKNASFCGVIISQFSLAPPRMAATLRIEVGYEQARSSSFVGCNGREHAGLRITLIINRVEYLAVSPVAKKNSIMITRFVGENKENSKIRSFE
jgi:hypothetical protein